MFFPSDSILFFIRFTLPTICFLRLRRLSRKGEVLSRTVTSHDLIRHPTEHYYYIPTPIAFILPPIAFIPTILFYCLVSDLFLFPQFFPPCFRHFSCSRNSTALLPTFSCSRHSYRLASDLFLVPAIHTFAIPPMLCFISFTIHSASVTLATG